MAYQWSTTHTYSLTPYVGRGLHIQVSIRLYGKGKGGEALNTVLGELPAFAAAAATAVLVVCGAVCEARGKGCGKGSGCGADPGPRSITPTIRWGTLGSGAEGFILTPASASQNRTWKGCLGWAVFSAVEPQEGGASLKRAVERH
jgi:hypothetical protein